MKQQHEGPDKREYFKDRKVVRPSRKKKKTKGKLGRRVRITILSIVLIFLVGGSLTIFWFLSRIPRVDPEDQTAIARSEQDFEKDSDEPDSVDPDSIDWNNDEFNVKEHDGIYNILLIGQDRREGETRARSDTMIIATLNTKKKSIILTSLMRDMYVPIYGYDDNRINAAYAFGGMELLDKVIALDFGVHIDGNIEVDFDGFIQSMTSVGNLDIELNAEEAEYLNQGNDWNLHAGVNSLNPEQVLAYARTRYVGNSDWERTERQRRVLVTAFNKLRKSSPTVFLSTVNEMLPNFTTDMTNTQILRYVSTVLINNMSVGNTYRIPVDGMYTSETIRGMSVLVPDLPANAVELDKYITEG